MSHLPVLLLARRPHLAALVVLAVNLDVAEAALFAAPRADPLDASGRRPLADDLADLLLGQIQSLRRTLDAYRTALDPPTAADSAGSDA
jgi:hypothetical protein